MITLYSEIFDEFNKATTKAERIAVLQKHRNNRFIEFLHLAFDPDIEFDVEIPNYKPSVLPAGMNDSYIHSELSKIYRFIKDHPKRAGGFDGAKQSQILLLILENLYKDEAELLIGLFRKNLNVKYLTIKLLREAYPDDVWFDEEEEEKPTDESNVKKEDD